MRDKAMRFRCGPIFRRPQTHLLIAMAVLGATGGVRAANSPINVTGWNTDIIADSSSSNLLSTLSSSTNSSGGFLSYTGYQALYAQGLNAAYPGGTIHSIANTNVGVATGTTFQLQGFSGNNALLLGPGGGLASSATLTLAIPSAFSSVSFLIAAFDSSSSSSSAFIGESVNYDAASGVTLAGTGNLSNKTGAPNGALLGADYSQDVWAGNVNLSASAYISGGYSGSLTISGIISGPATAAVGFSSDSDATTILANANTYTGETQIVTQTGSTAVLQLGVPNAINSSSGLNFVGGQSGQLDLNGNPVSFAYLTGNSSNYLITNSSSTPATLNIVQKAGTNTFAGQIADGGGQVALKFTGTGNQTLTGSNTYSGGTTVNSGTVTAASVSSLGTGIITLNGGGIIFSNTSPATVFTMIQSGFNKGNWNGSTGINSTTAASDPKHLHAVGMYQPATATTFEGQPLGTGDVAVKYTYYGDANLDGTVNSADYALIDAGFLSHGPLTGWQNGDFNYDDVINGSDYTLIDNAFNTQGASLADTIASPTAQISGSEIAAVPEPTTLGSICLVAGSLLARRRRR